MLHNLRKNISWVGILAGGLMGGLGLAISFPKFIYSDFPSITWFFASLPFDPGLAAPVLGTLIGGSIGGIVGYALNRNIPSPREDNALGENSRTKVAELKLHEEQLDIIKKRLPKSDVSLQKKVIVEEKSFTIPVKREELTIKVSPPESSPGKPQIIRIPLREEQVEITKHPIVLEDVSIYLRELQEIEHIEEAIKREVAHVETHGDCKVTEINIKTED